MVLLISCQSCPGGLLDLLLLSGEILSQKIMHIDKHVLLQVFYNSVSLIFMCTQTHKYS